MPTIQALGTAFTAMKVAVNTKTKQQLEEEESIGQTSDTSKTSNTQKPNDKTISPNDNEQTVIFADPTNGNLVKLNLSNKNIEKLKSHFSNEDFYERKDKTLRLNGEAEAYVSGWFGDIAYKREFLKADADNDGKLSEGEYRETRNGFLGVGEDFLNFANGKINIIASTESIEKTYVRTAEEKSRKGTVRYNDDYKADSIESELNTTIRIDADVGSTITLDEAYKASSKNAGLSVSQVVTRHIGEYYSKNEVNSSDTTQTDADLELLALQMRATQKLLASNGNENILTAEEREALGTELSIIKQSFKRKKELQEVKDEVVSKTEETRFLDTVG